MNICKECGTQCNNALFCSRSCNVKFQNKHRDTSFSKELKCTHCVHCNDEIQIKKQQSNSSAQCQRCALNKANTKTCEDCHCQFQAKCAKFCPLCRQRRLSESGRKSAARQALDRRSWSEIELGKLCKLQFLHVTFNDPIFPNDPPTQTHWDADILIYDYNVAILWNGPWHYRKLRSKHNLEQVQQRDTIKLSRIKASGWHPIVIKDDKGQKNIEQVNLAFENIIKYCESCAKKL